MPNKSISNIVDRLSRDISSEVGNIHEDDIDSISNKFDDTLNAALKKFNSSSFDEDGFVKRVRGLQLDGKDGDVVKNVLNTSRSDYVNIETLSQAELLLRRDIDNICMHMPEMRDVIYLTRDNIIEANTATGEVSRTLMFENIPQSDGYISQMTELENRFNLLYGLKNFTIPSVLKHGEKYVHVLPYAKLFAELEALNDRGSSSVFKESIPNYISESFQDKTNLYSDENLQLMMESVNVSTKVDASDEYRIDTNNSRKDSNAISKDCIKGLLESIDVYNGSSALLAELGKEGFKELVYQEYVADQARAAKCKPNRNKTEIEHFQSYMEQFMTEETSRGSIFNKIDQDDIDTKSYSSIKGCYLKYMDSLKMLPIRLDRRIIGYYYVTTTMDLKENSPYPNGVVDLSAQYYTKDKQLVDRLASLIIRSFDKGMLMKNVKLKSEIADIIMAHKFSDGKLSFVYIPENEIVRYAIDEDEYGKGHSMLEPSIFSARSYIMLDMYNKLYTLNNGTTRIHYLKSSGLNKNYAAQIQRTIRKFQARRISIDDIYSYTGAMNKISGIGEMVLPAGRGDYKAIETDTIEAARNPIDTDYIEQQRRQALSGTGAPHLLIINAMEEVDFAKTVELANARYQSRCNGFKIDINKPTTELYQKLARYCTDMDEDVIQSFRFKLNDSKQQDLNITSDMIQNFNSAVEVVMNIYGGKSDWEDEKGNPTHKQINLRKAMARKYLPQLDIDELDEIMKEVELASNNNELQDKVAAIDIEDKDIDEIKKK